VSVTCCVPHDESFHQVSSWHDHPLPSYSVIAADTLSDLVILIFDLLTLVSGHSWRSRDEPLTPPPCLKILRSWVTTSDISRPLTVREESLHMRRITFLCTHTHTHTHNRFTALFPGPPGWAGARRELLDFMVQGKINTGKHTDHPAGRHSIRTNQCPPPPSPIFTGRNAGCPSCHPTNSVKALKVTRAFGLGRRR